MKHTLIPFLIVIMLLSLNTSSAQFKDRGTEVGISIGGFIGDNEGPKEITDFQVKKFFLGWANTFHARIFLDYPLASNLRGQFGAGIGQLRGKYYKSSLIPIDLRLSLFPFNTENIHPYGYLGIGAVRYEWESPAYRVTPGASNKSWDAMVPLGVGVLYPLNDNLTMDFTGGYTFGLSDDINGHRGGWNDSWWSVTAGIRAPLPAGDSDKDKDGLTDKEEKQLGTNPKAADTDGDGLSDGDEVKKYFTDPLKADSDGDGLNDADELNRYKTDPLKTDTDGDGLNDKEELLTYNTEPTKRDTDNDGLSDYDEVMKFKTNPLKADTDGDGLSDGEEVIKYKTDPLKRDTDNGSVDDGTEVKRGSNPLDAKDDVPVAPVVPVIPIEKPVTPKTIEVPKQAAKEFTFETIYFKSGSAYLNAAELAKLKKAVETLKENTGIKLELSGHTDSIGKLGLNMRLSKARAASVKEYLVKKGVKENRLESKGCGPENPVSGNNTPEGREKNRRVEIKAVK
ncbi:MAG: OmpA family protein [bacterium]